MIQLIEGKIRLVDLAEALGTTATNIRLHLKNKSPLRHGAVKFADRVTGDYLLEPKSVLNFLAWMRSKSRKVSVETLLKLEEEIKQL